MRRRERGEEKELYHKENLRYEYSVLGCLSRNVVKIPYHRLYNPAPTNHRQRARPAWVGGEKRGRSCGTPHPALVHAGRWGSWLRICPINMKPLFSDTTSRRGKAVGTLVC